MTSYTLMAQPHPTDPLQAVTHANPYPYYAGLRRRAPLVRDEASGFWIAARARTVRHVLDDERLTVRPATEPVPRAIAGQPAGEVFARLARMSEGKAHRIARQALVKGLSAVRPETVFRSAYEQAAALIERFDMADVGLLDALAYALPVRVIAGLVGLPADDALDATVRQFVACLSPASSAEALRDAHAAASALQGRLHALTQDAAAARASALIDGMISGGLNRSDSVPNALVSNLLGLFSQTFDATAGLVGNSVVALARQDGVAACLDADASRIDAFVHEVARFDPAVHNTRRFARETVSIEGVTLKPGETVLVVLAAASRDETVFEDAEHFRLDRRPAPLPGFGAGRHACPGDVIARAITAGIVAALVASRFDFSQPALQWTYRPSLNGRIPKFSFA